MADIVVQRCRTANCPNRQEGPLCEAHGGSRVTKPARPSRSRKASPKRVSKPPASPDGA